MSYCLDRERHGSSSDIAWITRSRCYVSRFLGNETKVVDCYHEDQSVFRLSFVNLGNTWLVLPDFLRRA